LRDALQLRAARSRPSRLGGVGGLTAAQWARVAVLCSFVEPLPHEEACDAAAAAAAAEPAAPVQPGAGAAGLHQPAAAEAGLEPPRQPLRRPAARQGRCGAPSRASSIALLPRRARGRPRQGPMLTRWAVEDAWRNPLVPQSAGPPSRACCRRPSARRWWRRPARAGSAQGTCSS
jgi:hypothetical protein